MTFDTLLIAAILVWDVWHGRKTLEEQRRGNKTLEDFLASRSRWYTQRTRTRAALPEEQLVRGEAPGSEDGEREAIRPNEANGSSPDLAAIAEIADMSEDDVRGRDDN